MRRGWTQPPAVLALETSCIGVMDMDELCLVFLGFLTAA